MRRPRVVVAQAHLGQLAMPADHDWMSVPERERLAAIYTPQRRAQFVGGRWLIRQVLAEVYGGDARIDWPLSASHDAPPRLLLEQRRPTLHLSLSHSADHLCCAVGEAAIGIDIEDTRRRRDLQALAELVFTPIERRHLAGLVGEQQPIYFYKVWTLKEAWLKCGTAGMSPDAMARLQTQALTDAEASRQCNARYWRGDGFVMSLVMPSPMEILWAGAVSVLDEEAMPWQVAEI